MLWRKMVVNYNPCHPLFWRQSTGNDYKLTYEEMMMWEQQIFSKLFQEDPEDGIASSRR